MGTWGSLKVILAFVRRISWKIVRGINYFQIYLPNEVEN